MKTDRLLRGIGLTIVLSSGASGQIINNPDLATTTETGSPRISVEGVYWRPTGLDLSVVAPTSNAGASLFAGPAQGLEYGFAPGYRAAVDWGVLTADWLDLASDSDFSASCPSSNDCLIALQDVPGGIGHTVSLAQASSQMRLQSFDLGVRLPIHAGTNDSESTLYWRAGARYAKLWNNTRIYYLEPGSIPTTLERDGHTVDSMYGVQTGLEGRHQIFRRLRAEGLLGASLLSGRSHRDESIIKQNTDSHQQAGTTQNIIVPVLEISAKLTYSFVRGLDIWIGYDFIHFSDVLIVQEFTNNIGAQGSADVRQSVSFQGPRAGLSWAF